MTILYWYATKRYNDEWVQGARFLDGADWSWQDLGWWPSECVWIVPGTIEP